MTVVTEIRKRGEAYHIRGLHDGQPAGFSIAAKDVEALTRDEFLALIQRNLPDCLDSIHHEVTV